MQHILQRLLLFPIDVRLPFRHHRHHHLLLLPQLRQLLRPTPLELLHRRTPNFLQLLHKNIDYLLPRLHQLHLSC